MNVIGLRSGAVLQRDKNDKCKTILYAEKGKTIKTTLGEVSEIGGGKYLLGGIPVGGPYSFSLIIDDDKTDYTDVYVGDLWLLGGQSNMEGAGIVTKKDEYYRTHTNEKIRAFYMEYEWRPAVPLLHRLWMSKDSYIAERWKGYRVGSKWEEYDKKQEGYPYEQRRGIGPGFSFVTTMFEITDVPQGVIPCGIGASSLSDWEPNEQKTNYYTSMINKLKECGSNARGLYWDQGEAETYPEGVDLYNERMKTLVESIRKENYGELSVVFDQLAYNELWNEDENNNLLWTKIREKQRLLPSVIDNSDTVSTINANLSDLIHKDSVSQYEIGRSAAISMAYLCGYGGMQSIKIKGFKIVSSDIVPFYHYLDVYFENVSGELKSNGIPRGFSVGKPTEKLCFCPYKHIQNVELMGDYARIKTEMEYDDLLDSQVWYGIGNNCVCTISDSENRYLPAFGGLRIKDFLLK